MFETIALIVYSVGLVGIGMFLGYDLRKFMESENNKMNRGKTDENAKAVFESQESER